MKADIKLDDTRVFIEGDRVGVGVSDPQFIVDVGDRMSVRQGGSPSSGIWFYQNNTAADRAFVGMESDHSVGFWGHSTMGGPGAGWGVVMNTKTGDLNVRANLSAKKIVAEKFIMRVQVKLPGGGEKSQFDLEVDVWETIQKLQARVESLEAEVKALKKG